MKKAQLIIALSVEHNLTPQEYDQAKSDAVHAAQRSLLAHSGADGAYVRDASPTKP